MTPRPLNFNTLVNVAMPTVGRVLLGECPNGRDRMQAEETRASLYPHPTPTTRVKVVT